MGADTASDIKRAALKLAFSYANGVIVVINSISQPLRCAYASTMRALVLRGLNLLGKVAKKLSATQNSPVHSSLG